MVSKGNLTVCLCIRDSISVYMLMMSDTPLPFATTQKCHPHASYYELRTIWSIDVSNNVPGFGNRFRYCEMQKRPLSLLSNPGEKGDAPHHSPASACVKNT